MIANCSQTFLVSVSFGTEKMANTTESPFFSGNIGDAIVLSKSKSIPLVVAIQGMQVSYNVRLTNKGDDNDSKRLVSETWINTQVRIHI